VPCSVEALSELFVGGDNIGACILDVVATFDHGASVKVLWSFND